MDVEPFASSAMVPSLRIAAEATFAFPAQVPSGGTARAPSFRAAIVRFSERRGLGAIETC